MIWIKKLLHLRTLPLSLGLSIISAMPGLALTELQRSLTVSRGVQNWKISQNFIPPNRGTPNTTAGGGTRSSCGQLSTKVLTPLIPQEKLGLTFTDHPTFYWFVPQINAQTAEFSLLDNHENIVYETTFALPDKPGIIGFTLRAKTPILEVGKQYHWYLAIACRPGETEDKQIVQGWVERTQPTPELLKKLATTDPKKLSRVYATSGIWHEALNTLVQQRCTSPKEPTILTNWQALLTSAGLKNIVSEPLVNSCTLKTR
ncbi:DUF928 domain-containing protein [Cylindrospermum sp. FACHB-282]|uniref:DUF928 domain-containing protein n=1 Tax=Cylindrospermum sp. FACHB-282 TaxID=2692794 RepID=UPI0016891D52|nr:DUF928 domain-containing protein [Cylindrospermum sp. FACHB-282]MBD2385849.1 DUF928 domain-containing protein [Cylindrospermum sp. FACHB-282]